MTNPTLDEHVKQAWINALRSGEYRQGRSRLAKRTKKGNFKFCCLGVLCDVVGVKGEPNQITDEIEFGFDGETMTLPDLVWKGLGLTDPDIDIPVGQTRDMAERQLTVSSVSLATLNDDGFTFPQIADLIDHFVTPLDSDGKRIIRPGYEGLDRS